MGRALATWYGWSMLKRMLVVLGVLLAILAVAKCATPGSPTAETYLTPSAAKAACQEFLNNHRPAEITNVAYTNEEVTRIDDLNVHVTGEARGSSSGVPFTLRYECTAELRGGTIYSRAKFLP